MFTASRTLPFIQLLRYHFVDLRLQETATIHRQAGTTSLQSLGSCESYPQVGYEMTVFVGGANTT